jgi:tRNA threonylcarbamoyladenosine biosynthesis protein TsaB
MHLLAISTSTAHWSVWLHRADGWQRAQHVASGRGTGDRASLTRMVWDLLAEADLRPADLQRVVADVGPGSFTGLRQGLALARALAWAHGIATHGASSLYAMALAAQGEISPGQALATALPARANVDFVGWQGDGVWQETALNADDAAAWWQRENPALLVSAAADQRGALAQLALQQGARVLTLQPQAEVMGRWSLSEGPSAASELTPRYLAVSEAENKAGVAVPDRMVESENKQTGNSVRQGLSVE